MSTLMVIGHGGERDSVWELDTYSQMHNSLENSPSPDPSLGIRQ